jgi:hypothetical protein
MYIQKTRAVCGYRLVGWSTSYTTRMHVELSFIGLCVIGDVPLALLGPPLLAMILRWWFGATRANAGL